MKEGFKPILEESKSEMEVSLESLKSMNKPNKLHEQNQMALALVESKRNWSSHRHILMGSIQ